MPTVIDGTTGVTMPAGGVANTAGAAVGTTDTQTLTNKTIQGGALTLATAQNSTSGTFIDFTGIPSWVKRITVMFSGVSTSGTAFIRLQFGAGSVESTGYNSLSTTATSVLSTTASTSGFDLSGGGPTSTFYGQIICSLLGSNIWTCSGILMDTAGTRSNYLGGSKTLSGTLDRVRITTVNGTDAFDAGSINIMYEG